jgi:glycolate oxidase iron-sulfur subunit
LHHGQQINGVVERLLRNAGYELAAVKDSHLCCGSAGTYSVLQPQMSARLKHDKLAALAAGEPDVIATANVGCQTHLAADSEVPVVHWIELLK